MGALAGVILRRHPARSIDLTKGRPFAGSVVQPKPPPTAMAFPAELGPKNGSLFSTSCTGVTTPVCVSITSTPALSLAQTTP